MLRYLKTSHAGAAHQYASQEQYHDFHDGDTDEEIVMEPAPVAAPDLIMVSDDEEDPEEVNPEEGEPTDQPNQEEQAPGEDLEDHHGPEVEEEEQEQDEADEEVIWEVEHHRVDGVGIPMADHLRAMVLHLGYDKAPVYHCELWTHPWFEPHWEVAAILEEYVPFRGAREVSKHPDVAHRTTMDAGIAEAACRALYVLSHKERDRLEDTYCRYTPFRASGEAKTYIAPTPAYEGTLNNVRSLLAAVNTALDDTNNTLHVAQ
jgi:PAS domain-containing protein